MQTLAAEAVFLGAVTAEAVRSATFELESVHPLAARYAAVVDESAATDVVSWHVALP